jgi:hypothetical protein
LRTDKVLAQRQADLTAERSFTVARKVCKLLRGRALAVEAHLLSVICHKQTLSDSFGRISRVTAT